MQHTSCNERVSCEQNASYPQFSTKIMKLENLTRHSSVQRKSASMSTSLIVMTQTHIEVMGPVALGN